MEDIDIIVKPGTDIDKYIEENGDIDTNRILAAIHADPWLHNGGIIAVVPNPAKAEEIEEMMQGAEMLSRLPIDFIKLHQLQILKGTRMAEDYKAHPEDFVVFPKAEDYVALVREYRKHLRSGIKIERYVSSVPSDLVIAPKWGLKPYEIKALIENSIGK